MTASTITSASCKPRRFRAQSTPANKYYVSLLSILNALYFPTTPSFPLRTYFQFPITPPSVCVIYRSRTSSALSDPPNSTSLNLCQISRASKTLIRVYLNDFQILPHPSPSKLHKRTAHLTALARLSSAVPYCIEPNLRTPTTSFHFPDSITTRQTPHSCAKLGRPALAPQNISPYVHHTHLFCIWR